jgi:hypothetical protein
VVMIPAGAAHKKLNICRRTMTTIMIMGRKKTTRKKKRATRLKAKMIKTTLP